MFFIKFHSFFVIVLFATASTQELEPLCNDEKTEKWVLIAETISNLNYQI